MAAPAADGSFTTSSKRPRIEGAEDTREYGNSQGPPGGEKRTKPCTKFYSMSGCQYGEGCHFLHYVPGGLAATGLTPVNAPPPYNPNHFSSGNIRPAGSGGAPWPSKPGSVAPTGFKTKLCTHISTPEGCRFGAKCHFAHGEVELRADRGGGGGGFSPNGNIGMGGRPTPWGPPLGSRGGSDFQNGGRSLTWPSGVVVSGNRVGIPVALVGAVIGKGGANVKQIARVTSTRVSVKEVEGDPDRRSVELEGNGQQVEAALQMLQQFLQQRDGGAMMSRGPGSLGAHNFKTKICDKFVQGTCTFGERCHFAHGASDLREPGPR